MNWRKSNGSSHGILNPMKTKESELKAENRRLIAANTKLLQEVEYWKGRCNVDQSVAAYKKTDTEINANLKVLRNFMVEV